MKTIQTKPDMQKGDIVWTDASKTQVKWEPNFEGKFIAGCDPYYKPTWWEKILIWLHLKNEFMPPVTIMELPKDYVDSSKIKIPNADNKN
jgi:hypothetical protein